MLFRYSRRLVQRGILALALGIFIVPSPANARALLIASGVGASIPLVASLGTGSSCTAVTYDKNGNRVSTTPSPVEAGPVVWGSKRFGCFIWKR